MLQGTWPPPQPQLPTHFAAATRQTLQLAAQQPLAYPLLLPCPTTLQANPSAVAGVVSAAPLDWWDVSPLQAPSSSPPATAMEPVPASVDVALAWAEARAGSGAGAGAAAAVPPLAVESTQGNKLAARSLRAALLGGAAATSSSSSPSSSSSTLPEAVVPPCPPPSPPPFLPSQPHVLFLGTGAAAPSKLRSCSALYVSLGGGQGAGACRGLLLDAGEGALGKLQLQCFAGQQQQPTWQDRVAGLCAVWVSHMHADHHTGLLSLLWERWAAGAPPLLVAGPPALLPLLRMYSALISCELAAAGGGGGGGGDAAAEGEVRGCCFRYVECSSSGGVGAAASDGAVLAAMAQQQPLQQQQQHLQQPLQPLSPVLFRSIPVDHCAHASGCALGLRCAATGSSVLLAYSGDTRPSAAFAAGVAGAQDALLAACWGAPPRAAVLVHEATFTSDRAGEAAAKRHSTVQGALGVGASLHARSPLTPLTALVLTHFSQRYASHGSELERGAGGEAAAPAALEPEAPPELQGLGFPVLHAADLLRVAL